MLEPIGLLTGTVLFFYSLIKGMSQQTGRANCNTCGGSGWIRKAAGCGPNCPGHRCHCRT